MVRLNGFNPEPDNYNCSFFDAWESYEQRTVDLLRQVTLAHMDALTNYFFWTWKIANSTVLKTSSNPLWHYKLGLERGWIPAGNHHSKPIFYLKGS
jgi:glucan 1,3-beta-glucosidase